MAALLPTHSQPRSSRSSNSLRRIVPGYWSFWTSLEMPRAARRLFRVWRQACLISSREGPSVVVAGWLLALPTSDAFSALVALESGDKTIATARMRKRTMGGTGWRTEGVVEERDMVAVVVVVVLRFVRRKDFDFDATESAETFRDLESREFITSTSPHMWPEERLPPPTPPPPLTPRQWHLCNIERKFKARGNVLYYVLRDRSRLL